MSIPDPDEIREKQNELLEVWLQNEVIPYVQRLLTEGQKRMGRHKIAIVDTHYGTRLECEPHSELVNDIEEFLLSDDPVPSPRTEAFPEIVEACRCIQHVGLEFDLSFGWIKPYGVE